MSTIKDIVILTLIASIFQYSLSSNSFQVAWNGMQNRYKELVSSLYDQNLMHLETNYCHPYWKEQKNLLKTILLGPADAECFTKNPIQGTMVCSGFSDYQIYELDYLTSCISEKTASHIFEYKDTPFPQIPFECAMLNCSSNTLVHLYYAAHVLEHMQKPQHIVEFGGGYGNLARIFKTLIPEATIIIIDLPELIALQYLFLSVTAPHVTTLIHNQTPDIFEQGMIHLLPIHLIDSFTIKTDVFISTFALSEAPAIIQQKIIEAAFFQANIVYITGQLHGWIPYSSFEQHYSLFNALRTLHTHTYIQPFHYSFHNQLKSYEILSGY